MFTAMIVEENEYLVVYSVHNTAALLYQRLLKRLCKIVLISTPVKISYGCSQSIKFKETYIDIVIDEIAKIKIKPKGVYKIVKKTRFDTYKKI